MNNRFANHLQIVTVAHVAAIAALMVVGMFASCRLFRPEASQDIEFTVDVTPNSPGPIVPDVAAAEPEPMPEPEPAIRLDDKPKKSDKKEDKKKEKSDKKPDKGTGGIQISTNRVVRQMNPGGRRGGHYNPVSAAEIQRLLNLGARPSDRTVIPADDDRCKAAVKNVLYDCWSPPGKQDAGRAVAQVRLWFGDDGRILRWKIEKPSGVPVLDDSVEQVFGVVRQVPGLSVSFLREYKAKGFSVDFTVREEGAR